MFNNIKTVYFVGIKGVGMTALAQILQGQGMRVSGSDTGEKFFTDEVLARLKIPFKEGFRKNNIPKHADLVVSSVAYIHSGNVEIKEAKKRGITITTYPEALAELFNNAWGIAVTGSHGKSTTSAMLGFVLEYAGLDPTVVVGSCLNQWKSNARVGRSKYFIIEADEYRDAFLRYWPRMILLTNIDYDHPDYFPTEESYAMSFKNFTKRVSSSMLIRNTARQKEFNLSLPGQYNLENANLAYLAALKLGISAKVAKEALEAFDGLARRFESYGTYKGALLFDDYAHHPSEIRAVLKATRKEYPHKKIVVLFQPHTFSRTKALFKNFTQAFSDADTAYILKTYGSAREKGPDVWGKKLAEALHARYFASHKSVLHYIEKDLDRGVVFLTLGAGDGWQVLKMLKK